MRHVAALIDKVSPTSSAVVVSGETGTGKEVVARAVHARSPRRAALFVSLDCAELLEAEPFGCGFRPS